MFEGERFERRHADPVLYPPYIFRRQIDTVIFDLLHDHRRNFQDVGVESQPPLALRMIWKEGGEVATLQTGDRPK